MQDCEDQWYNKQNKPYFNKSLIPQKTAFDFIVHWKLMSNFWLQYFKMILPLGSIPLGMSFLGYHCTATKQY